MRPWSKMTANFSESSERAEAAQKNYDARAIQLLPTLTCERLTAAEAMRRSSCSGSPA
jgi:hypothetical protein